MNGAKVLVTGATGFFGGWLVKRLLERGVNVHAVVRAPRPQSQFYANGYDRKSEIHRGSVYDPGFLQGVIRAVQPEYMFHAACPVDVVRALQEPVECFRTTIEGTWEALDAIRQSGHRCVTIVTSSDKAYGTQELPYRESQALRPLHPYDIAKASSDLMAQCYGKVYGLPVAITRCGNFFGPFDFSFARLIPGAIRSAVRGENPVLRSDGRFTRDFLYIEDAVDAHLLLAERLQADASLHGEAFNFSYGEEVEVLDIVKRIIQLSGAHVQVETNDNARAENRHMHLASDKARTVLNWKPRVGFDDGLRDTVLWYAAYLAQDRAA